MSELQTLREHVAKHRALIEAHDVAYRELWASLRMHQYALEDCRDPSEASRFRALVVSQDSELNKRRAEKFELERNLSMAEGEVAKVEAEIIWIKAFLTERARVKMQYERELAKWADAVASVESEMTVKQARLDHLTGGSHV